MIGVRRTVEKKNPAVRAATAVFADHGEFIRTVICIQAGGTLDPEDLYQEFYLLMIRKPMPADVQNVRSYLYRAIHHHVIDAVRSRKSYSRTMKKYAQETKISINNGPPRTAFIEDEQREATVDCLARNLRDQEARAFVLKYRDECSIHDIATKMGINKRTVSRYLSEGLRKLHRRLATE